ncbi:hypothetical protein [Aeromicrobium sp.]|nr:hypothetical protein [Aeromicrobium sp.]
MHNIVVVAGAVLLVIDYVITFLALDRRRCRRHRLEHHGHALVRPQLQ